MTEALLSREVLLTRTLVKLADTLVEGFDIVDLFTFLADRCVEILDVAAAGLMLPQTNGELGIVASSSEAMHVLEAFERSPTKDRVLTAIAAVSPSSTSILPRPTIGGLASRRAPLQQGSGLFTPCPCTCETTRSGRSTSSAPTKAEWTKAT